MAFPFRQQPGPAPQLGGPPLLGNPEPYGFSAFPGPSLRPYDMPFSGMQQHPERVGIPDGRFIAPDLYNGPYTTPVYGGHPQMDGGSRMPSYCQMQDHLNMGGQMPGAGAGMMPRVPAPSQRGHGAWGATSHPADALSFGRGNAGFQPQYSSHSPPTPPRQRERERELRPASCSTVPVGRLPNGTQAEYFSTTAGGTWIPCVVENFCDGYYVLDVHPMADPSRIRPKAVPGGESLISHWEILREEQVILRQYDGHPSVRVYYDGQPSARVITEIPNDTQVVALQYRGDWAQVRSLDGNVEGWIGVKNILKAAQVDPWLPWEPGVPFHGVAGERIEFNLGPCTYYAVFDSPNSGVQVDATTGKQWRLRRRTEHRFSQEPAQPSAFPAPTRLATADRDQLASEPHADGADDDLVKEAYRELQKMEQNRSADLPAATSSEASPQPPEVIELSDGLLRTDVIPLGDGSTRQQGRSHTPDDSSAPSRSMDAFALLEDLQIQVQAVETRIDAILEALEAEAITAGQARDNLAQVEARLSKLQCNGIDSVSFVGLEADKADVARSLRKELTLKAERLQSRFDSFFKTQRACNK